MKNTLFKRRSINLDENSYQRCKLLAQDKAVSLSFSSVKPLSTTKQLYDSKMAVDLAYNNKLKGTVFRLPVPNPILKKERNYAR
jgi:hypothetical protein